MESFFPVQCSSTLRRVGLLLKQARLQQDIRQVDITDQLGVSLRAYRRIEAGDPQGVSLRDFMLVLWNLGITDRVFQSLTEDPSFSAEALENTEGRRVRLPKSNLEDF